MSFYSLVGSQFLGLSFAACFYSFLIYWVGAIKKNARAMESARRANSITFLLLTGAVATLIAAFLNHDYSILYVYSYSSSTLPLFFKITGLWAGLDGSILFWTWLVSLYAFWVVHKNRHQHPDWIPIINAVMMLVVLFFLALMLFANNPFTPLQTAQAEGKGLNPLLQNWLMVIHPPMLYLGFTGFTVPFAFVIAALISKRLDSEWIDATRRWSLVAWTFLSFGLVLGGAWAYVELGWGGFWAWDPVENAALMPWLTATAYLHSVMVQKRRGMLLLWNVILVMLTFTLTIFGTYLTRSGVVQSVHAFSESNLGPFFLTYIAFIIVVCVGLILWRIRSLESSNILHSFFSREAAFLLNNVLFVVATFAVLWGTLFPTLSELVTGERITVGPPFFNHTMSPIGLGILLLMGVGPMISWKRATLSNLKMNLLWPYLFGFVCMVAALILGLRQWYAVLSVFLIAAVFGTLYLEFYRGIRAHKRKEKSNSLKAAYHLLRHSNRRYGAYVVHVGILLIFIGITGAIFKSEADFSLLPGQSFDYKGYRFSYVEPRQRETSHQYEMIAVLDLSRGDQKLKTLKPAKYFYKTQEQPSTEVDIYGATWEDVYVIIGNLNSDTGRADFRVTLNPLITFLWKGTTVLLIGVAILLLPAPKTISMIVLALLLGSASGVQAASEHDHDHDHAHVHEPLSPEEAFANLNPEDPLTKRLMSVSGTLTCKCGGCVRMSLETCTCGYAKGERDQIMALLQAGKTDNEIREVWVSKYGLSVLTTPPREGFFEFGYWVPALILIIGLVFGGYWIGSWRKRKRNAVPSPSVDTLNLNSEKQKLLEELKKQS